MQHTFVTVQYIQWNISVQGYIWSLSSQAGRSKVSHTYADTAEFQFGASDHNRRTEKASVTTAPVSDKVLLRIMFVSDK